MEVGAVKQAFNNEVILLKKKLNQAKIQIIHKLTRKAKMLTEKKAPEHLKDKNKRKAESAIQEVLIIKKLKAMDLAKFIITHKGELMDFLNKPKVDTEKACTRLLLHKALQEKYQFIRNRFRDVPIKDLFMSRQERLKLKKEAREKKKNKKKGKSQSEGEWKVEDVKMTEDDNAKQVSDEDKLSISDQASDNDQDDKKSVVNNDSDNLNDIAESYSDNENETAHEENQSDSGPDAEQSDAKIKENFVKLPAKIELPTTKKNVTLAPENKVNKIYVMDTKPQAKKLDKKLKENKNKNINEKILKRKFKKETEDEPVLDKKIVDPFFITESGENYMSVAEPRQPDEVKEVHKEGNRKLRRAVMFGHIPKPKTRKNYGQDNNNDQDRYGKQNGYEKNSFNDKPYKSRGNFNDNSKTNERSGFNNKEKSNDRFSNRNMKFNDEKPEKLHPSWEAKKRQSGILPFQGKKIVFNES